MTTPTMNIDCHLKQTSEQREAEGAYTVYFLGERNRIPLFGVYIKRVPLKGVVL